MKQEKDLYFYQTLQTSLGIRNSYLVRIYLVVNKVFVVPNQDIICKYVAREIGNIHSSCGSDSGAISLSHSWDLVARRGGETF